MAMQSPEAKAEDPGALQVRTLPRWEELPDLDLYMDQVLSLMERYLGASTFAGEKGLTAAMVNNYVKIGLLPAPQKKKYGRAQLACLIVVCVLKPVLPLAVIQTVLSDGLDQDAPDVFYNRFCGRFEAAERQAAASAAAEDGSLGLQEAAVAAALSAQAYRRMALSLFSG